MCNDMLHATCYILATHAHTTPTAEDGRRWHRERVEGWCAPKDDHSGAARVEHWHAPDTKTTYTKKVHHGKAQTQDLHLKLSPYTRNYHLILETITLYSHLVLSPYTRTLNYHLILAPYTITTYTKTAKQRTDALQTAKAYNKGIHQVMHTMDEYHMFTGAVRAGGPTFAFVAPAFVAGEFVALSRCPGVFLVYILVFLVYILFLCIILFLCTSLSFLCTSLSFLCTSLTLSGHTIWYSK